MKKNILTVVILASCIVNLVLTAILVFSVVPAMNKTNKLIDKVAEVIDLETEKKEEEDYKIEDLIVVEIPFESKRTINLKADKGDTEAHFAMIDGISVSLNPAAEDYEKISASVNASNVFICDCVNEAISEQTISTLDEASVKELALKKIQDTYNSKCIVRLSLSGFMFQ